MGSHQWERGSQSETGRDRENKRKGEREKNSTDLLTAILISLAVSRPSFQWPPSYDVHSKDDRKNQRHLAGWPGCFCGSCYIQSTAWRTQSLLRSERRTTNNNQASDFGNARGAHLVCLPSRPVTGCSAPLLSMLMRGGPSHVVCWEQFGGDGPMTSCLFALGAGRRVFAPAGCRMLGRKAGRLATLSNNNRHGTGQSMADASPIDSVTVTSRGARTQTCLTLGGTEHHPPKPPLVPQAGPTPLRVFDNIRMSLPRTRRARYNVPVAVLSRHWHLDLGPPRPRVASSTRHMRCMPWM